MPKNNGESRDTRTNTPRQEHLCVGIREREKAKAETEKEEEDPPGERSEMVMVMVMVMVIVVTLTRTTAACSLGQEGPRAEDGVRGVEEREKGER